MVRVTAEQKKEPDHGIFRVSKWNPGTGTTAPQDRKDQKNPNRPKKKERAFHVE
jgi:hypothetical protein